MFKKRKKSHSPSLQSTSAVKARSMAATQQRAPLQSQLPHQGESEEPKMGLVQLFHNQNAIHLKFQTDLTYSLNSKSVQP